VGDDSIDRHSGRSISGSLKGGGGEATVARGQLYAAKYGRGSLPFDAVYRVDGLEALLEVAGEWGRVRRIEKL
jgi:hypothetical protein